VSARLRQSARAALRIRSGYPALAALGVRLVAGGIFIGFGMSKFTRHAAEAQSFDRYGLPVPGTFAYVIGVVEVGGAVLLIGGLLVRLAALMLAGDMVGAITTAGVQEGGVVHLGLAPSLLLTMLFLLWAGAGLFALDRRLLEQSAARSSEGGSAIAGSNTDRTTEQPR
jgi:putative oxidoreductase